MSASFPAALCTVQSEELDSPLGRLDCRVYRLRGGDQVTTFWFAVDRPGMPVRVETRSKGRVTSAMEMVGDSVGS